MGESEPGGGEGSGEARSLGQHGDGLDLDEPVGPDERLDADQRARRRVLRPDVLAADLADGLDVLGSETDDEDAGLHDVAEGGPGRGERALDILEGLSGLR